MAIPLITNLKLWVGTLFTKDDWDFNFKQIVSWLADGNADLVVGSVKVTNGLDLDGATIKNVGAAQTGSEAINLDQAQTLLNRSSYYYPFSVASGKVDSDGNPAYLQKDSDTQVTVLAGNVNPDLVCVQSDGTIESVTANVTLTVPISDGTYHIIKEKETTITITSGASNVITIGKKYPSSPLIGDYFLDNSVVPFKGSKYTANGWEETSFCWLGDVTVSSGTATVTTFSYNNNYFDVNSSSLGLVMPDYESVITGTIAGYVTCNYDSFVVVWGSDTYTANVNAFVSPDNGVTVYQVGHFYTDINNDTWGSSFTFFVPKGWGFTCNFENGTNYNIYKLKGAQ